MDLAHPRDALDLLGSTNDLVDAGLDEADDLFRRVLAGEVPPSSRLARCLLAQVTAVRVRVNRPRGGVFSTHDLIDTLDVVEVLLALPDLEPDELAFAAKEMGRSNLRAVLPLALDHPACATPVLLSMLERTMGLQDPAPGVGLLALVSRHSVTGAAAVALLVATRTFRWPSAKFGHDLVPLVEELAAAGRPAVEAFATLARDAGGGLPREAAAELVAVAARV